MYNKPELHYMICTRFKVIGYKLGLDLSLYSMHIGINFVCTDVFVINF